MSKKEHFGFIQYERNEDGLSAWKANTDYEKLITARHAMLLSDAEESTDDLCRKIQLVEGGGYVCRASYQWGDHTVGYRSCFVSSKNYPVTYDELDLDSLMTSMRLPLLSLYDYGHRLGGGRFRLRSTVRPLPKVGQPYIPYKAPVGVVAVRIAPVMADSNQPCFQVVKAYLDTKLYKALRKPIELREKKEVAKDRYEKFVGGMSRGASLVGMYQEVAGVMGYDSVATHLARFIFSHDKLFGKKATNNLKSVRDLAIAIAINPKAAADLGIGENLTSKQRAVGAKQISVLLWQRLKPLVIAAAEEAENIRKTLAVKLEAFDKHGRKEKQKQRKKSGRAKN